MPNGHSGGFAIEASALKRLLRAVPETAPVGMLTGDASDPRLRPVNATEVLHLVEKSPYERLSIEEQDHSFYIVHISDEPTLVWLSVKSDSPLFAVLALAHSQWKLEHPS
jgi:hypothetical protein